MSRPALPLNSVRLLVIFLFAITLIAAPISAQTVTGTLQGTVLDATGSALPGATVTIQNTEMGQSRVVLTNSEGAYSAPFLSIGPYRVTASLEGLGSATRERVQIQLNQITVHDFTLSPSLSDQITVVADRVQINTTDAQIKGSLNAEQIIDKPTLSTGQFLSLAETFAGFQENPVSGQNNPTTSSGSSINFNGTGTRGATFQINGVNNDDSSENQNRQGVALSTIKEFVVITNNYVAEFGRGYGAVVLVQTKSGTNTLKGDLYWFRQDSNYNMKSFFSRSQPKAINERNQYGFTAGMPFVRDRLFGFFAFDQTERIGETNYAADIFLPADLSRPRLTRGNDTPANRAFIESVLARFPMGTPNDARSARGFATVRGIDQPAHDYSGRIDWNPIPSNLIFARYQDTQQTFDAEDIIIGEQVLQNNKQNNLGITWTHLLSGTTVGEARFGLGNRSTNADVKAGNDTPIIRFFGTTLGSILGNAGTFPIHRDQTDQQYVYNLSSLVGKHTLKAGTDVRRQKIDDLASSFDRGFYNFNRVCGGTTYPSAYEAFLDGCVATYTKGFGPFFLENRIEEGNLYVQDNWQVLRNLNLDLGVRYEYVGAPEEKENRVQYGFKDDMDNFDPRLGFAYTPDWNNRMANWLTGGPGNASIRGGYGVFTGRVFQSAFSQSGASLRQNPPNALDFRVTGSTNLADPTNGFVFVPGPQTLRHSITIPDPDLEMPFTRQWNLTFERKLPLSSSVRISYTKNQGVDLLRQSLDNLPVSPLDGPILVVDHPNNAPTGGQPDLRGKTIDRIAADALCAGTGFFGLALTTACPRAVPIADNEISQRLPRVNQRRPDPRYGTNTLIANDAQSDYEGIQFEVNTRPRAGLHGQLAYTWSEANDTVSDLSNPVVGDTNQTGPDNRYAFGYSRFHTRHRLTLTGSYLLPFFRDRDDLLGNLLGGWQISPVVKITTGSPFSISDSTPTDLNFDGFGEARPVLLDRRVLGTVLDDPLTSRRRIPASAFRDPRLGDSVEGLVPRNAFFTDGVRNLDLGIYKNFKTLFDDTLALRFEIYNVFDRAQFGIPNTDFASANFGAINGMSVNYTPRTYQAALRYQY